MSLTDVEWTLVQRLVIDDLVNTGDPYGRLETYFPNEVSGWRITPVATENADFLVQAAKRSPLSDDRPFSIRLLTVLTGLDSVRVAKPADMDRLTGFIRQLTAEKKALDAEDHFGVRVLPRSQEAFIDRAPVRGSLRELLAQGRSPQPLALCVTGDDDSGKSFIYSLIRHLAQPYRFMPLRVVVGRTSTADDILRDFLVRVTRERPTELVSDPAKRLRYWAQWLVAEVGRAHPGQPCWFVIDEGNELDPNSDAIDFIAKLAEEITETSSLPGVSAHRLVLLGWRGDPQDLPVPRKQVLLPEYISPINADQLREFFEQCVQADFVDESVRYVLDEAEQARVRRECYMTAIATATQRVLELSRQVLAGEEEVFDDRADV